MQVLLLTNLLPLLLRGDVKPPHILLFVVDDLGWNNVG